MVSGETPSNIILCGIVAYILYMLKGFKRDVKNIHEDLIEIKIQLGIKSNVVKLPDNKESSKP